MPTRLKTLESHQAELKACTLCPDMIGPVITGHPSVSKIIQIGQAPGIHEGRVGRPFGWTAGKTLFKWYETIGISEEDFRKILENRIDTNAMLAECSVDKKVCTQVQETYKLSITKLEEQLKKNNSWFDRNRGTIGLVTGLAIGAGLSIGIVHAVYQK